MTTNKNERLRTAALSKLYGQSDLRIQMLRYENLERKFKSEFGINPEYFFSAPGRTEISGNHTDHNYGRVIAASVNLDAVAAVAKSEDMIVTLFSEGFKEPFVIDLKKLAVVKAELGTTGSLIRGIAKGFAQRKLNIGGFKAYLTSDVLVGSGLSSSAAIEVLIGKIFSFIYNKNLVDSETLAIIGQFAENIYFGKPCGLMDQMACATGGIITIDFENPVKPKHEKLKIDFNKSGYELIIIDTGGSHADLTEDYASIPSEMKSVAKLLGKKVCRDVSSKLLLSNISLIRDKVGDRAFLRAFHFVNENDRVVNQVFALKKNNFADFLRLVTESGNSSFKWLQNIYSSKNVREQSVTVALAIAEKAANKLNGACRVHGGGFAGTIQVFIPKLKEGKFIKEIEKAFSKKAIKRLSIRNYGVICLNELI